MSTERLEVLKMLADKVITVEEAERLLGALAEGERKRETAGPRARSINLGGLDEIGAVLGNVGEVVEDALQEAFTGFGWEGHLGPDMKDVVIADGAFSIPAGSRLTLRNRRGGASLELAAGEGDRCAIESEAPKGLRVRQGNSRTIVTWDLGALKVRVPTTVATLKARLMGGNLSARDLPCPARLKTMGGDLDLRGLVRPFDAKTLGGTIALSLDARFSGDGRAVTMGGDIAVELAPDLAFAVSAVTMGGGIEADPALGEVADRLTGGGHRTTITSKGAAGAPAARLEVKTMGGNISIRRCHA